jgi:hypothetical protein
MWLHPDSEDIKALMAIIQVDSLVKINSDKFEELKVALFEDNAKKVDEYII